MAERNAMRTVTRLLAVRCDNVADGHRLSREELDTIVADGEASVQRLVELPTVGTSSETDFENLTQEGCPRGPVMKRKALPVAAKHLRGRADHR
jgi:hypothetical protein